MSLNLTEIAAWFGALGALASFGSIGFDIYKHKNDKGKLKIKYNFDLEIMEETFDGKMVKPYPNQTFWSIDICNIGSKELIINQIGFDHSHTKTNSILTKDLSGPINRFTLTPGDNRSCTISNELIDPKKVKTIIIMDATGKVYKQSVKIP